MTIVLIIVIAVLAVAVAGLATARLRGRTGPSTAPAPGGNRRILFPFVAEDLSRRALDAALRLAAAEGDTLVPVFLARVSLDLPLDTPLPRQCSLGMTLLEAIEQRATEAGVPVDSRIERGRNRRHALRQAIVHERFDRIVIAAASRGTAGFEADDVAWLLGHAAGEIVVLRPGPDEEGSILKPAPRRRHRGALRERGLSREGEMAGSR